MIATESRGRLFNGLYKYLKAGRDGRNPERVEWSAVRNLDPALARPDKAMRDTAAMNPRARKPVIHFTLDLPPGEHLTRAQWEAATDRLLANLGLSEHEVLIVAHNDRRHEHIHLMVNAIHPESGEVWDNSYSKHRTNAVVAELEHDHGLRLVTKPPADARIAWSPEDQAHAIRQYLISSGTTFTEKDLRKWSEWREEGDKIVALVMNHPEVQALRLDGGERHYADVSYLDQEAAVFASAEALAGTSRHAVAAPEVERLDPHQAAGMKHILEGQDLAILVGRAGTGKTTMLEPAVKAWQDSGYRVIGAALAGKAADGLGNETGIQSRTLASWKMSWQRGRESLDSRTVLLVDEAGMVDTDHLALVLDRAQSSGAKVVLIGDPDQLQPVAPGSPLRLLAERHGAAYLETIWRQREPWQREATLDLANGQIGKAVQSYATHEHFQWTETRDTARESLVSEYLFDRTAHPERSQIVLSYRNEEVAKLNQAIREGMVADAHVDQGSMISGRLWSGGDRVIFLKNDHGQRFVSVTEGDPSRGVSNGTLGSIEEAGEGKIVARLDDGRQVSFDPSRYSHYDYGYAATVHRSQGMTVDHSYVLADDLFDRNASYVALSRHRESVSIHADTETLGGEDQLIRRWSRGHDQGLVAELKLDTPHPPASAAAIRNSIRGGMTPEQEEVFYQHVVERSDAESYLTPEESAALPRESRSRSGLPVMTDAEFAKDALPSVGDSDYLTPEEIAALPRESRSRSGLPVMTDAEFAKDALPSMGDSDYLSPEEIAALPRESRSVSGMPSMTDAEFAKDALPSLGDSDYLTPEEIAALPKESRSVSGMPSMTDAEFAKDAAPSLGDSDYLSPEEIAALPRVSRSGSGLPELSAMEFARGGPPVAPVEPTRPEVSGETVEQSLEKDAALPVDSVEEAKESVVPSLPVEPEAPAPPLTFPEDLARVASLPDLPEEISERLKTLAEPHEESRSAARELALVQNELTDPEHVAEVAVLRLHMLHVYDPAADRFHITPREIQPIILRELVLDAADLERRRDVASQVADLQNRYHRAELESSVLKRHEPGYEQAMTHLSESLSRDFAQPREAAKSLTEYAGEHGVRSAMETLRRDPSRFGENRAEAYRAGMDLGRQAPKPEESEVSRRRLLETFVHEHNRTAQAEPRAIEPPEALVQSLSSEFVDSKKAARQLSEQALNQGVDQALSGLKETPSDLGSRRLSAVLDEAVRSVEADPEKYSWNQDGDGGSLNSFDRASVLPAPEEVVEVLKQSFSDPESAARNLVHRAVEEGVPAALSKLSHEPEILGTSREFEGRRSLEALSAASRLQSLHARIGLLQRQLQQMEPSEVLTARIKGHAKNLGHQIVINTAMKMLPPNLQVPARMAYRAAKTMSRAAGHHHEL